MKTIKIKGLNKTLFAAHCMLLGVPDFHLLRTVYHFGSLLIEFPIKHRKIIGKAISKTIGNNKYYKTKPQ